MPQFGRNWRYKQNTTNMSNKPEKALSIKLDLSSQNKHLDDSGAKNKQADLKLMCIDLQQFTTTIQFLILTGGVFFFFLIYGYFQELIFRLEGFKPFGWYLTLMQFGYYVCFGLAELQFKEDKSRRIPIKTYILIAFLTVATMGLSNSSLGYLNYPTQVIFKCCKLIPVLFGGILIQGKRYGVIDFMACLLMSVGLIFFTLADSSLQPNFNMYGVLLISLALCADAVIGNVQEKAMKQHSSSNSEMVLYSYGIGFMYIFVGLLFSGQLFAASRFCIQYPMETYGYGFIFSLTGYLGVNVVLSLVKSFGALVAVTVTTCRKALTIILSFMFFTKPFTSQYIWSGMIVVLGIYLNIYSKNQVRWNAYLLEKWQRIVLGKKRSIQIDNLGDIV